jgi:phage shock protein PspC (stress-responsive transcriptional regulator)
VHDRLYRSRDDRMLFGVAGGMADWLDIDPAIVRIVWALLIFAGGAGLLLYIVAAIVIPEEPLERADVAVPKSAPPAANAGAAAGTGPGPDPTSAAATATGSTSPPASAGAASTSPAASAGGSSPWATGGYPTRRAAREARRAERRAARGQREGNGILILGVVLIALGGWLLARMYIPFFDDRIVGPAFLVIVGILVLASGLNRPRQSPPS